MATLNKVTDSTKFILKWIGILILIFVIVKIGGNLKQTFFPPPKPPAQVLFGKLPRIEFPKSEVSKKFFYSIDTLEGTLPVFPDRIFVYKIEPTKADLLAFERAKNAVSNLGFNPQSTFVSENVYQWQDSSPILRKINIDIFSSDFSLTSSYLSEENKQSSNITKEAVAQTVKKFLEDLSLFPNDTDTTKTNIALLYKKNYVLIPTTDASLATNARIDFFQSNVNNLPIFYPRAATSTMNFIVENVQNQPVIVSANFVHQQVSKERSTYPIKTTDQAFAQLKEGKAYIAVYNGNAQNIPIKSTFLAYFLGENRQEYLLPIIVFQGDNFVAYVPAVTDGWVNN